MSPVEIQEIKKVVQEYNRANISKILKDFWINRPAQIGRYNLEEFTEIIETIMHRFDQAIENGYIRFIPSIFNTENVVTNLENILFLTKSDQLNNLNGVVEYLVSYQITYGLMSLQSSNNQIAYREDELDKAIRNYRKIHKNLHTLSEEMEKSVLIFDEQLKAIDEYRTAKSRDLDSVDSLVNTARKQIEEINDIARRSNVYHNELEVLFTKFSERSNIVTEKLENSNNSLSKLIFSTSELKSSLEDQFNKNIDNKEKFDSLLNDVDLKSETFNEKLAQLNEILGKEAAIKLFNTFNARKAELKDPVKYWAFAVFGVSLVSFFLIVALFTNGFGLYGDVVPKNIDWKYFLITLTKTIPILLIFYFTIRQYNRERTFMEEYAFRSAIALTIQAYADLAGDRKAELIMSAVTNIYAAPKSMRESSSLFGFSSRHVPETLKEIKETLATMAASVKKD